MFAPAGSHGDILYAYIIPFLSGHTFATTQRHHNRAIVLQFMFHWKIRVSVELQVIGVTSCDPVGAEVYFN